MPRSPEGAIIPEGTKAPRVYQGSKRVPRTLEGAKVSEGARTPEGTKDPRGYQTPQSEPRFKEGVKDPKEC